MLNQGLLPRMRADTLRFIRMAPMTITLRKSTKESDGSGGQVVVADGTRPAQVFTLLEPRNSNYLQKLTTAEGTNTTYDFMLLGEWNAVVGLNDEFTYDGLVYRVENILPNNGYETRAMVLRTGEMA